MEDSEPISSNHNSSPMDQESDTQIISIVVDESSEQKSFGENQLVVQLNPSSMAHFKIISILGRGGMGTVYKAKDLALDRFVAIKMLRLNSHLSTSVQPLMLSEAQTISQLNHPNIVTVYDIARDNEANFIVMECVDGRPLNAVIPTNGLAITKVMAYFKQMVAGIACAHQQHIIHRDIKPQNIMVTANGVIKILDFGIAALIDPTVALAKGEADTTEQVNATEQPTLLTPLLGSPQYMAPEHLAGQVCDVRSDLFSLGIVLYEMLTGVKPGLGVSFKQISQAITNGYNTSLAEVDAESVAASKTESNADINNKDNAALLKELIVVVSKLLQPKPSARYQTAHELAQDINATDEKFNRKKTWFQQQHGLTKTLLVMPVIAVLAWGVRSVFFPPTTHELITRQLVESKKIAFLPFENISGDPVLQLFSDGIVTMLSSDLAEVGYQQADGKTWVLPFGQVSRMADPSITGIYNKYGVHTIVTGSIQHMGSTRSIHLSLVNGNDGRQLKSLQLTIDANKLFEAQRQIREQVMVLLGWKMPPLLHKKFAEKKPAFDGAYQFYVKGQGYLYRFDYKNNIEKAHEAFMTAINIDPNYADAYAGLAAVQLRSFITSQDVTLLVPMESTVEKLRQIASHHPLLSYLQGELKLNRGEYAKAIKLFSKSIDSDSQANFMKAYIGLSDSYLRFGELLKAEQVLLKAYNVMPNNILILNELGAFYLKIGDYHQAFDYFKLLSKQAPNNYIAYLNMSACHYYNGDVAKAILAIQHSLTIQPNANAYSNLGTYNLILKNYDKAVVAYEKMIDLSDRHYMHWGNLADAYRLAKNEKYIGAYKKAITLAEQSLTLNPNNKKAIALLAYYHANVNELDKTNYYAKHISERDAGEDSFLIAAAYARLNSKSLALKYLGFAINNNYSIAEIINSPMLDSLKNEAKYSQLLAVSPK